MSELTYWPKRAVFYFLVFTLHIVLTAVFWRKKKSVPPIRNQLLLKSANQLAKEIREGKLKSEEVIQTYINRILEVEPYINAVVQDNFDGAIEEAKKVDALIKSGKFSIEHLSKEKPLLGVPFTVKCLLKVKGFDASAGSLIFKDRIADTDAEAVAQLKNAGGIFLALTNSAEFGLSLETTNHLHGTTCNPYDTTRTCGGSSGGEAALISAAGSIIGLGNDLCGSVRIPAHLCGVFAHKPSSNLIPIEGNSFDFPPDIKKFYSVGPMCRFSEDLNTMMKVLLTNKNEINFRKEVDFKNIKIYYQTRIEHACIVDTDEEIVQAIQNAALYFEKNYGTRVKEIKIPLLSKMNAIALNSYSGRLPSIIELVTCGKIKKLNRIAELVKTLFRKCQFTFVTIFIECLRKWPIFFNKNLIPQCDRLKEQLKNEFEKLLDECSLFLCPTLPKTSPFLHEAFLYGPSICYTSTFNMLELPATQCPMGLNKQGLPLGIQIVAKKGNDVLTLLTAAELENAFGGWTPP